MLKLFSTQLLVNSEIFKLSLNLSLKLLRVQSGCYELKGDLSPIVLKEIFHNSLQISKFTMICMENLSNMTRWQKLFLVQILLNFDGHCNCYFWEIRLKSYSLPNFNMLFQKTLLIWSTILLLWLPFGVPSSTCLCSCTFINMTCKLPVETKLLENETNTYK